MNQILVLPTEQEAVVLRQLTIEDAPAYFNAVDANREHLSQFGDTTAQKYPTLESVQESILNPTNPDKLRLGIWDEDTFVGSINLTPEEDGSEAEIGYWLDARHTGKGYATVATRALANYAKNKFPKVRAEVAEGNEASVRVLERVGFEQTAQRAGKLVFELVRNNNPEKGNGFDGIVRSVELRDLEQIQPILELWVRDRLTGTPLPDEVNSTLDAIASSIKGVRRRAYLVAQNTEGQVVGVMGLAEPNETMRRFATTPHPVEFINAYVDSQERGRGAGRALAQELEQIARDAGYTEVLVNSGPRYRDSGWPFWTKLYGEPVAIQKELYGPGGDAPVWRKSLLETA